MAQSCFEYNPNQIILDDDEKNLTEKYVAEIQAKPAPDTIKMAFMGDTQRFYDEAELFVKDANKRDDITFIMHGGDISDFGLVKEFRWVHDIMSESKVPYLTAVGNHDLLANGKKVYREMYGDYNYTFTYGNYLFVILDTNSREYEFNGNIPDLNWLSARLEENTANRNVIVISHVPPYNSDFDDELEAEYASILANDPNVVLSLHAHEHSYLDEEVYGDGVRYFVTTTVNKEGYALLSLWDDGLSIERVKFDD
nr:metallophosphoesterase [Fulvivirga aurantia]